MTFEERLARLEAIAGAARGATASSSTRARAVRGRHRDAARARPRSWRAPKRGCSGSSSRPTARFDVEPLRVSDRAATTVDWTDRSRRDRRARSRDCRATDTPRALGVARRRRGALQRSWAAASGCARCSSASPRIARPAATRRAIARRTRGGDRGRARVFARPRRSAVHGRRRHAPRPADGAPRRSACGRDGGGPGDGAARRAARAGERRARSGCRRSRRRDRRAS